MHWLERFLLIYFLNALPEELLFRGAIQNLIQQRFGRSWKTLAVAAIIFGLAHINNPVAPFLKIDVGSFTWNIPWVYVLLATIAGFFYCFVFIRTKKITAAAAIHLLVDWVWYAFFN